jgi:glycosyltransferase involved in cell wall biosynthesis
VLPAHGAFPELVAATGGGLVVEADSAAALADGLLQLLKDPERRRSLADAGRRKTWALFHAQRMAGETLRVFHAAIAS